MATSVSDRTTAEETMIWFGLILTYPCYLVGGLYILGSVLGWLILAVLLLRGYVEGRNDQSVTVVPVTVWIWVAAMLAMLVALWVAHLDRDLGAAKTLKSSIGWVKGWALLALFPLLGAVVPFKLAMLVRGCCVIVVSSLVFAVFSIAMLAIGSSGQAFVSPLSIVGGPGPEFFTVQFFAINPETGLPRWSFFGPWAPAAGLLSCLYLVICSQETDLRWRNSAVLGTAVMCLLSQSRAGWALFVMLTPVLLLINHPIKPAMFIVIGVVLTCVLVLGQPLFEWLAQSYQNIKDSRPDSTRVRSALAQIALQRWQSEAPLWGHGIVERGPKIVEHMPIGTHHSWYGLLFVKGWVGAVALAVPMLMSTVYLSLEAMCSSVARVALILVLILIGYSFFENLEILVYLFWPALLWLGAALNPLKTACFKEKGAFA